MKPVIVILAAGRPFGGNTPSDQRVVDRRRNVLEWQVEALAPLAGEIEIVTGYEAQHLVGSHYRYVVNTDWETTGSAYSLFCAQIDPARDLIFCYSDILFRSDAVEDLKTSNEHVSVAVDSMRRGRPRPSREMWRAPAGERPAAIERADSLNGAVSDLVGLVRVPARFVPNLLSLRSVVEKDFPQAHVGHLLQLLLEAGVPFRATDVAGNWSDLDDDASLARFLFGTKAETLARLAPRLKTAIIQPQRAFTVSKWKAEPRSALMQVIAAFGGQQLAVRSSSLSEDGFLESNAGRFRSLLAVDCNERALSNAIEEVIASFDTEGDHQVLIQPMVPDIVASGVLITRTLSRGAPYYVVNFTLGSAADDITSGRSDQAQIAHVHRDHVSLAPCEPIDIRAVIEAVREIEQLTDLDALDVEFAVTKDRDICILQVRPLVLDHDRSRQDDERLSRELVEANRQLLRVSGPVPGMLGARAIFGVMPDWNPAEIIGTSPSPLSASIYRFLIMDDAWAQQRAEFGYRDMRPVPLQHNFAGHPYVDVRASINSFIPATLDEAVAARIVEAAVQNLADNPQWHDKIEFDVVPTCLDLDFARWKDRLSAGAGLNAAQIAVVRDAYGAITRAAPAMCESAWSSCLSYEHDIGGSSPGNTRQPLERVKALLGDCRARGTPAFAHLARCGFVAASVLRTAVSRGVITASRLDAFLLSVHTVSHQFREDGAAVHFGSMSFEDFAAKYGHLRPGTYDIESQAYGDNVELFLRSAVQANEVPHEHAAFSWTQREARAWRDICREELEWDITIDDLTRFFRRAIEGREYSKFVFTRALSMALDEIVAWGKTKGLSRRDLSCLEISDLIGDVSPRDGAVAERIARNRELWKIATDIELPALIREPQEIFAFVATAVRPNFVTKRRISAKPFVVHEALPLEVDLKNRIVLIERADPGFDWLFGRGIDALVTAYGGANSHMAIRCAEFGIPAAIGVGTAEFSRLSRAALVELNCEAGQITVVE